MKIKITILFILLALVGCSSLDFDNHTSCNEEKNPYVCMKKLSASNNMVDQNRLGDMYNYAIGLKQDYKKALYWYTKSANQGYVKAQNNLAIMYESGVFKDIKKSRYWLNKSIKQGDVDAISSLGETYSDSDYEKQLYLNNKAIKKGSALAENNLGTMYFFARGANRNYTQAAYWFIKSAKHGSAVGLYDLAFMYEYGYGLKQDIKKSIMLYTKSYKKGYYNASHKLASIFSGKDKELASYVYRDLPYNYNSMRAFYWTAKSAQTGNIVDQYRFGNMFYGNTFDGDVLSDIKEYEKSLKRKNTKKITDLDRIYSFAKNNYSIDNKLAFYWYKKSAMQGVRDAQIKLANGYNTPNAGEKNLIKSYIWYDIYLRGYRNNGEEEFVYYKDLKDKMSLQQKKIAKAQVKEILKEIKKNISTQ